MDATLMFWPKIGDRVTYTGSLLGRVGKKDVYVVKELVEEFPCTVYIIQHLHSKKTIRAFRHQLDLAQPDFSFQHGNDNFGTHIDHYICQ